MGKETEKQILTTLFSALNDSKLEYCVLRNYRELPDTLGGSDLDIAVLPEQLGEITAIIKKVLGSLGGIVIIDYDASLKVLRFLGCWKGVWWGLAVDIFSKIEYKGVEYISTQNLLSRVEEYNNIKISPDYDADTLALIKELLSNGKTRKNYFGNAVSAYNKFGRKSLALLEGGFSTGLIERFESLLLRGEENLSAISAVATEFRQEVTRGRAPSKTIKKINNLFLRLQRVYRPPGFSLAVLGTDGSGKSTMIERVTPILEDVLHATIQYEHLRPNWLPALGVATGQREANSNIPVPDPHSQKPSGFIGSIIRLSYYSLDYIIGYWVKIYPSLVRSPHICIFDRYHYDLVVDPRRMRIQLPTWVIKLFLYVAPKPKLIICLGGNPEVIYGRKPETTLEEVERQTEALKNFCQKTSNAVWIDTSCNLSDSENQVMQCISDYCSISS